MKEWYFVMLLEQEICKEWTSELNVRRSDSVGKAVIFSL